MWQQRHWPFLPTHFDPIHIWVDRGSQDMMSTCGHGTIVENLGHKHIFFFPDCYFCCTMLSFLKKIFIRWHTNGRMLSSSYFWASLAFSEKQQVFQGRNLQQHLQQPWISMPHMAVILRQAIQWCVTAMIILQKRPIWSKPQLRNAEAEIWIKWAEVCLFTIFLMNTILNDVLWCKEKWTLPILIFLEQPSFLHDWKTMHLQTQQMTPNDPSMDALEISSFLPPMRTMSWARLAVQLELFN